MLLDSIVESGDADEAAEALFLLGMLLAIRGDVEEARAAYQQAIDTPATPTWPRMQWSISASCSPIWLTCRGLGPPTAKRETPAHHTFV